VLAKVATWNSAGGARADRTHPDKYSLIAKVLGGVSLIGVQEIIRVIDPATGDVIRDDLATLTSALEPSGYRHFFFPHLDSLRQSHSGKWSSEIFGDYYKDGLQILQGTAVLVSQAHPCGDLLQDPKDDQLEHGCGQILPWYDHAEGPTFYRGNRDTEPRALVMTRVRIGSRFVVFCCTHLTTLKEEDVEVRTEKGVEVKRISTKGARDVRELQARWIADHLQRHQRVREESSKLEDVLIVVGDFNAERGTDELEPLKKLGLEPVPAEGEVDFTHREHLIEIDLVFAPKAIKKSAEIVNLSELDDWPGQRISDHHPVIAEIEI